MEIGSGSVENMVGLAVWKVFKGKRVFVTGHTGFKGSWLALWLNELGAHVSGFSLPASPVSLFRQADVADICTHVEGDVRDLPGLQAALHAASPEIVFHLAAQPLVREGYRSPVDTWSSNVMGTVNLLEAVRHCPSVRAVVIVTTDKCYDNREWPWGYRENDNLGGDDPYSASKAACELAAAGYRKSFLDNAGVLVSTARAGNVIGGGDYGEDRILPDAYRSILAHVPLLVRQPESVRPWQHVLCALHGYLLLAAGLLEGRRELARAFNFGPAREDSASVRRLLEALREYWPELNWTADVREDNPHEAGMLRLDASLARAVLGWTPQWNLAHTVRRTAEWYRQTMICPQQALNLCREQIKEYMV